MPLFPLLPFDSTVPDAPNNPSDDQPKMLLNNISAESIMEVDHIGYGVDNSGIHNLIHFNNQGTFPADFPFAIAGFGQLFTLTINADQQLFYQTGNGIFSQYVAATQGSNPSLAGIIYKWGNLTGKAATNPNQFSFPIAFPNSCFQVIVCQQSSAFLPVNNSTITAVVIDNTKFNLVLGSGYTTDCSFTYFAIGN